MKCSYSSLGTEIVNDPHFFPSYSQSLTARNQGFLFQKARPAILYPVLAL